MKMSTVRWIGRQIRQHYATTNLVDCAYWMSIGLDMQRYDAIHYGEPMPIQPNERGIALLVVWEELIAAPFRIIRMNLCRHPNLVDESYANGDSGCDAGHCPDCGWSFHVTMY